ncbi:pre-mRNA-splicing factor syf2 [Balamuthia mandrillaris]
MKRTRKREKKRKKRTKSGSKKKVVKMEEFHYVYTEQDNPSAKKRRRPEEDEREHVDESYAQKAALAKMTPRERKLAELKQKLKESRNENRKAVIEEDVRLRADKGDKEAERLKRIAYYKEKEEERREKEQAEAGLAVDPEKLRMRNTTVEDAQWQLKSTKKKKQRKDSAFGWQRFSDDVQHKAYMRRQKQNPTFNKEEYEQQKDQLGEDFFRSAHEVDYGEAPPVPKQKLNNLVREVRKDIQRREQFSRRREYHEDADVDFINEHNRVFNKKIGRAYDEYTVETKQNLERGTAV